MDSLYNLAKDLIRKESYFEVGSILEDLFNIKHDHELIEYETNNKTIFHRFYHDLVRIKYFNTINYTFLNKLHRKDGPATINYFPDGSIRFESWYQYNEQHREDGPAFIEYFLNGSIKSESWMQHNEYHRIDDPAYIQFYPNGTVKYKSWYQYGKLHRLDGPAFIEYDGQGNIILEKYYLHGIEV